MGEKERFHVREGKRRNVLEREECNVRERERRV